MTLSAGTRHPFVTHAVASSSGELPLPVYSADPTGPAISSCDPQVPDVPQEAPLDLCKPRRSGSPPPQETVMTSTNQEATGEYHTMFLYRMPGMNFIVDENALKITLTITITAAAATTVVRPCEAKNCTILFLCSQSQPTQPSIPPGSVNEYQLRLGRQRQVWFIPLADKRGVCR